MPETPDTWLEISVEVAGVDAETAADLLRQACPGGAVIEPAHHLDPETDAYVVDGDAAAVVRGYLPAGEDTERIRGALRLALQAAPLVSPARWRRPRKIREESWQDAWKKHFGIQRIGNSLIIHPSWVEYRLKAHETVIQVDPGMAFGTGQHPTTAMCLRAIEQRVRPGMSVLDLGCGSGILAIAAAKLGATRVLALDTDPQAVKATTENAAANGVSAVISAREGTLDHPRVETPRRRVSRGGAADDSSLPGVRFQPDGGGAAEATPRPSATSRPARPEALVGRAAEARSAAGASSTFDLIAANISGLTLQRLAPAIPASLNPGGALIASGFLEDAVPDLRGAFEAAALRTEEMVEDGVWRAIIAVREM